MGSAAAILSSALAQLGVPYVFGAETPGTAFDCSGLTRYAYAAAGIQLPHSAQAQQSMAVPVSSPAPGDLVFWGAPAYHVAIYAGDGQIVSAPQPGDVVKRSAIWGSPTFGHIPGVDTAIAPVLNAGGALSSWSSDLLTSLTGSARGIVIEVAVIGLGLALAGLGLYRGVISPATSASRRGAMELI